MIRIVKSSSLLREAQESGEQVSAVYNGHARELEIIGERVGKDGEPQVLAWQTGGSSASGGLPGFRRLRVARLRRVRIRRS